MVTLTDITSQRRLVSAVDLLSTGVESGELSGRIEAFPENRVAEQIGSGVNSIMGHVQNEMTDLLTSVELLAECNLDITMLNRDELRGEFEQIHKGSIVTLSNLTESIRQTIRSSEHIASAVSAISQQNLTLDERTRSQAEFLRETTSNIEEFSPTTENTAENARQAAAQGQHINQLTHEGRSVSIKCLSPWNPSIRAPQKRTSLLA